MKDFTLLPRLTVRAAIAILALAAVSLCMAAPAQAVPVGMEFSADGVTYTPTFNGVLFSDITLNVPGDSQSSVFWVRNTSASAGYLRVVLSDVVASGPAIADAITVQSSTAVHTGTAVPLSNAAPCWVLVEGDLVPAGGSVKVTSTLALGNLNGTVGQNENATLSVGVGMSDAAIGGLPPTSCNGASMIIPLGGPHGVLAYTGSDIPYPLLTLGSGALGVGLFLLVAARRRRQEEA